MTQPSPIRHRRATRGGRLGAGRGRVGSGANGPRPSPTGRRTHLPDVTSFDFESASTRPKGCRAASQGSTGKCGPCGKSVESMPVRRRERFWSNRSLTRVWRDGVPKAPRTRSLPERDVQ